MKPVDALRSLKPARGEWVPAGLGCLGTAFLNLVAFQVVAMLGAAFAGKDGALIAIPFSFLLWLVQWLYLVPLARLFRRAGSNALAKGLLLGGWLLVALCGVAVVVYGAMYSANRTESERVRRYQQEHPIVNRELRGTIVAADAQHIEVETADGVVSVGLQGSTHYVRPGPYGNQATTIDIAKVGAAVSIDAYSMDGGPLYASYVRLAPPESAPSPSPR